MCNCNGPEGCEVINGQESIKEAECFEEALDLYDGGHLPLEPTPPEPPEEY